MSEPAPASATVLEARGLTKRFGRRIVVDALELAVPAGTVYGFLGPNGAGKSTTLRMALGLIRPTAGTVKLMGHEVSRARRQALQEVGAQVETPAFYGYLSAWRNLQMLGELTGPTPPGRIAEVLARVRLAGREHDKVRTYSQGMRMRLGLAQALLSRPRLLILDEPTNGLDPQGMREVRQLIRELATAEGMTVFLSSHLLTEVQQVCDRVAVIHRGRLVAEGLVSELLKTAGHARVDLRCDRQDEAAARLGELAGVSAVEVDDEWLRVEVEEDAVADVNRALVEAGHRVSALVPRQQSLEEFFLKVTGEEG